MLGGGEGGRDTLLECGVLVRAGICAWFVAYDAIASMSFNSSYELYDEAQLSCVLVNE